MSAWLRHWMHRVRASTPVFPPRAGRGVEEPARARIAAAPRHPRRPPSPPPGAHHRVVVHHRRRRPRPAAGRPPPARCAYARVAAGAAAGARVGAAGQWGEQQRVMDCGRARGVRRRLPRRWPLPFALRPRSYALATLCDSILMHGRHRRGRRQSARRVGSSLPSCAPRARHPHTARASKRFPRDPPAPLAPAPSPACARARDPRCLRCRACSRFSRTSSPAMSGERRSGVGRAQ